MADAIFKTEVNGRAVTYTWDPEEYMGPDVSVEGVLTNYDQLHVALGLPGRDPWDLLAEIRDQAEQNLRGGN